MTSIQHVCVEIRFQAGICGNVLHEINSTEKSFRSVAVSVKWNMLRYVLNFLNIHYRSVKKELLGFKTLSAGGNYYKIASFH